MMKGIWFDNIHSYQDLNLVLSKVDIPPATVKTNYVDIPGADGSVDLTEALGKITYNDRQCQFTFTAFPDEDFELKKRQVSNLLNGQRCKIILDKDPNYYWVGRCSVDEYSSDKNIHKIVVGATVAPYKLHDGETEVPVQAGTNVSTVIHNGRKAVAPTIVCNADAKIVFSGNTFNFGAGTHKDLGITFVAGDNTVVTSSTGVITFKYQEGEL